MLNVREFGAVGDGVADDTAAIQAALDKAAETKTIVYIPAGTFLCSTLKVPSYVGLQGEATWGYREFGGSALRLRDDKAACLLDLTGAIGARVNGLSLDGGKLGHQIHGILVNKEDYGTEEDNPCIEHCKIGDFSGDGIHLGRIWCFSIRHSMVYRNGGSAVWVRGWDGFILDNWFSGNGGYGFGAHEENASITITANRIEWNKYGGIFLCSGSHYNITGNYIDRSGGPAIALRGSREHPCNVITVTGNVFYRSGAPHWRELEEHDSTHLRFEDVCGLACVGNTFFVGRNDWGKGEFSPKSAIVIRSLANSVIRGNALNGAALESLIVDLGGHGEGVVVDDNPGSLHKIT